MRPISLRDAWRCLSKEILESTDSLDTLSSDTLKEHSISFERERSRRERERDSGIHFQAILARGP